MQIPVINAFTYPGKCAILYIPKLTIMENFMLAREKMAVIFDIQRGSYVDGPGIRTTVFMKGCNLSCAWCHNPESKSAKAQRMWYGNRCAHCGICTKKCPEKAIGFDPGSGRLILDRDSCRLCGSCVIWCPHDAIAICGREMGTDELLREIIKDSAFYESSGGGMTISGGECMLHPDFVAELTEKCVKANIHTAVDTAGCVPWENFEKVLGYTNLFLYDIKCITPELHSEFVGADNSLILQNYIRLLSAGCRVIVRIPMIPEFNANDSEFAKISDFLHRYPPEKVELLPYHAMGESKFRALGLGEPRIFRIPDSESMSKYRAMVADLNQNGTAAL